MRESSTNCTTVFFFYSTDGNHSNHNSNVGPGSTTPTAEDGLIMSMSGLSTTSKVVGPGSTQRQGLGQSPGQSQGQGLGVQTENTFPSPIGPAGYTMW